MRVSNKGVRAVDNSVDKSGDSSRDGSVRPARRTGRAFWRAWGAVSVLYGVWAVVMATWRCRQAMSPDRVSTFLELLAFEGSGLMFFLLAACAMLWRERRGAGRIGVVLMALLLMLGVYARYIEPNRLEVRHETLRVGWSLRVALISDLHLGLYSTPGQVQRLVERLNSLDVDLVAVAGDWTHEPSGAVPLENVLSPFRQVRHPVYSVPGNHDEEMPGFPLRDRLKQALLANGIRPIEGASVDLGAVRLVGLNELWSCRNGVGLPDGGVLTDKPLLLLAHHPEAAEGLPPLPQGSVLLAGHTHGGQVRLPWLTDHLLQQLHASVFRRGLYDVRGLPVYITAGTGMVGLPLRFGVTPAIDVVEFR